MKITGFRIKNAYQPNLPDEDDYSWIRVKGGVVACVADGITRDPKNFPVDLSLLPNHNSPEFKNFIKQYPRPSPAFIAAELFVKTTLKFLKSKKLTFQNILRAIDTANKRIKKWNANHINHPNYKDKDLAGCVAILAFLDGKKLRFFYNSDCGLAIFDEKNKLNYLTPDLMKQKEKFISPYGKLEWNNPQVRARVRKEFRNKLRFIDNICTSYGAFTGEKEALSKNLLKRMELGLKKGNTIILFSDGARSYFDNAISKEASGRVLSTKGIKGLKKYLSSGKYGKRERTILAIKLE